MMRILKSQWTASLLGALLFVATLGLTWPPPPPPARPVVREGPAAGPAWTFRNPEVDQLVSELTREREVVAAKENELREFAVRLQTERAEIGSVTQAMYQMQADFDKNVTRVRQEEAANLKKLAKTYAAMTPTAAAAVCQELDDSAVVKIMVFMKEAETAQILDAMAKKGPAEARHVAALSERLRTVLNDAKKTPTP